VCLPSLLNFVTVLLILRDIIYVAVYNIIYFLGILLETMLHCNDRWKMYFKNLQINIEDCSYEIVLVDR
jgi:hypothetical protein